MRAEALFALNPSRPASPRPTQVHWVGKGNQYDILGPFWIVLSASQGTPAFTMNVTDLDSWLRVATKENRPDPGQAQVPDRFLRPSDFESADSAAARLRDRRVPRPPRTKQRAADPLDQVGPWSSVKIDCMNSVYLD